MPPRVELKSMKDPLKGGKLADRWCPQAQGNFLKTSQPKASLKHNAFRRKSVSRQEPMRSTSARLVGVSNQRSMDGSAKKATLEMAIEAGVTAMTGAARQRPGTVRCPTGVHRSVAEVCLVKTPLTPCCDRGIVVDVAGLPAMVAEWPIV